MLRLLEPSYSDSFGCIRRGPVGGLGSSVKTRSPHENYLTCRAEVEPSPIGTSSSMSTLDSIGLRSVTPSDLELPEGNLAERVVRNGLQRVTPSDEERRGELKSNVGVGQPRAFMSVRFNCSRTSLLSYCETGPGGFCTKFALFFRIRSNVLCFDE